MRHRSIVGNAVVETLATGHTITLASVNRAGREWRITYHGLDDVNYFSYEFTATRREAIARMRFVYNVKA